MRVLILLLVLWYAWRYSKTEVDPDWAVFNLGGFTGALYGRDFLDCKSPVIHIWYWLLSKVCRKSIPRMRFVHHVVMGLPGVIVGGWAGLAFAVLVNSGWLLAFHGNVGQIPAGLVFLALSWNDPAVSTILYFLAVFSEPKMLIVALIPLAYGWNIEFAVALGFTLWGLFLLRLVYPEVWKILVESNITITQRMQQYRRNMLPYDFTITASQGLLYLLPWLILGISNKSDLIYWLPIACIALLYIAGIAVRSNHYLVFIPWIALALPPIGVIALIITDLSSAFGYVHNIWRRFYPGLEGLNIDARKIGELLKGRPGKLWVNALHNAIYIYAEKPPFGGLCEIIEIRENTPERREKWKSAWKEGPPEWVVDGYSPGWKFTPTGYDLVYTSEFHKIYHRR